MNERDARRDRGNRLCRALTARIVDLAPRGLGQWEGAWELVDPPSAEFMAALSNWEASGTAEAKERLAAAFSEVLAAWRNAAAAFRAQEAPSDVPPERRT
ncbi:MAG: hypothetical protein R3E10_02695 [Gemmatimonadota bacterium]